MRPHFWRAKNSRFSICNNILTPPLFAPMTGVPHASDSSTTFPNVSVADGNTIKLEQAYASAKSPPCK